MKANSQNLASGVSAAACRAKETVTADDVHLPELVRSLRSLACESPERQAQLEELARRYAAGTYTVNAAATAAKIIDEAEK